MRIHRGDLYWARISRPDLEPGAEAGADVEAAIAHPHVILQDDALNGSRLSTVVVCALTSNLHRMTEPGNVLLEPGEGNLAKQSVVVVSQVSSIEKAVLGERIGSLTAERVQQIFDGMLFQQASFQR